MNLVAEKRFDVKIMFRTSDGGLGRYDDLISAEDHIQAIRLASAKFVNSRTFETIETFSVDEIPFSV